MKLNFFKKIIFLISLSVFVNSCEEDKTDLNPQTEIENSNSCVFPKDFDFSLEINPTNDNKPFASVKANLFDEDLIIREEGKFIDYKDRSLEFQWFVNGELFDPKGKGFSTPFDGARVGIEEHVKGGLPATYDICVRFRNSECAEWSEKICKTKSSNNVESNKPSACVFPQDFDFSLTVSLTNDNKPFANVKANLFDEDLIIREEGKFVDYKDRSLEFQWFVNGELFDPKGKGFSTPFDGARVGIEEPVKGALPAAYDICVRFRNSECTEWSEKICKSLETK